MTYEAYLSVYVVAVFAIAAVVVWRTGILNRNKALEIDAKRAETDVVTQALHGLCCPLCNGQTSVKSVDLYKSNTALLECNDEKCKQQSIWTYTQKGWHLTSPFRANFTPQRTSPILPPPPPPPSDENIFEKLSGDFQKCPH